MTIRGGTARNAVGNAQGLLRYHACGLAIESDIALPGLVEATGAGKAAEVTILRGELPSKLSDDVQKTGPNWELTSNRFLLRIPGLARFMISDGKRIEYQPEDGVDAAELTAFLTGSVLGILLHLRGLVVLHASAVLAGGGAILFCGASGAGKSTLAAALGERGYPLISDDLCVLAPSAGGRLCVEADGRLHKLWQRSLKGLDLAERAGDEVRHQINKFYVPPRAGRHDPMPVRRLYELREQRTGEAFEIERLALPDIALLVRRQAFRARMMWQLGQKTDYFRVAAALAAQGQVARFSRPLDFRQMQKGLDLLEADWRAVEPA